MNRIVLSACKPSPILSRLFCSSNVVMGKKKVTQDKTQNKESEAKAKVISPFAEAKDGRILISVSAKPGAKLTSITDISQVQQSL